MEAVVLAGGKGTRLQPFTAEVPKPLVTVGDRPVIEILLRRLARAGTTKAHLAVNHLAHLIMAVLADGSHLGLEVVYSREEKPLSTIAPLALIDDLPDHFIVANGDILTDMDFSDLFQRHLDGRSKVTVATCQRTSLMNYGVIEVAPDYTVTGFREKPDYQFTVSMGVYVFSREVLEYVPANTPFGFDQLMLKMLESGDRINTYPFDGYWLDIGRPEDYEQANRDIERIAGLLG